MPPRNEGPAHTPPAHEGLADDGPAFDTQPSDHPEQDPRTQGPRTQDQPLHDHPALAGLLGHWRGSTHLAAGPWGPERTVDAEVTYRRVAGGFAVVQSYRHVEADGTHFEGHGMFTVDPDHQDVLWYYVDSAGPAPDAPARCQWHEGVLRVERRGNAGWTRHTLRADGGVLRHVTELRTHTGGAAWEGGLGEGNLGEGVGANGTGTAYTPFMTSVFRKG